MPTALDHPLPVHAAPSGLARLVLGVDPVQRRAVKRVLMISQGYLILWLMLALASHFGYGAPALWMVIAIGAAGQTLFYAIIRAGWTLRCADPMLCYPQALFGCLSVVLGYAMVPIGQGAALQTLFIILVFDLHRLRSREIAFIAATTVALLGALVLLKWRIDPASINLRQEAMTLAMAVLIVPLLSTVSNKARQVRMRQFAQKAELDRVLAELQSLSQRDPMTGAVNRRHMMELLDDEQKRQRRSRVPFSLVMLDIDWFKRVNDRHGHAVGDAVLCEVAALADALLRETDVLARWGGEEFLLLLPASSVLEAGAVVDQLRQHVERHAWAQFAAGLQVTFSAGVTEHRPEERLGHTLERADAALYRAKELGRNRVEYA